MTRPFKVPIYQVLPSYQRQECLVWSFSADGSLTFYEGSLTILRVSAEVTLFLLYERDVKPTKFFKEKKIKPVLSKKNHSLCCPSLYPQMRGGEAPPLLAIVKLSTLQFPTVPAACPATVPATATTVAKAGLAIVWDY